MIMADLELYRGKEMSGLKERMAFSITQFTRGPSKIHRQPTEPNAHRSNTLDRVRRHNGDDGYVPLGWKKRSPSADRSLSKESEGVMNYYGLTVDQQTVDSLLSPEPGNNESASTTAGADSPVGEEDAESTDSKQDEVNLRTIYRYACRLMRETLDIEGVCIIEIDWEYLTGALKYRNDNNVDRDAPSHHDGKFDASSVVLGYSHSHQFGTIQRESWQPIKGWDDETLISINPINGGKRSRIDQSRHRVFTATDLSAGRDNLAAGRLSDHFVAGFISENVSGKLFNNGLPEAVSKFLPPTAAGAILVPLYDFDHRPFAITCAYSTDKHKKFLEEERQYLEVPPPEINLTLGIWIGYPITGAEGTNHSGGSIERNFHLKHLPRTPFSPPWYTRFSRIYIRHLSEYSTTNIHRLDRHLWSHSPRSHQSRSRLRQVDVHGTTKGESVPTANPKQ